MPRKLEDYPKDLIKAVLRIKGTTAAGLSETLGVHKSTVGKVIDGTSMFASDDLIQKILDFLQPDLEAYYQVYLQQRKFDLPGKFNEMIDTQIPHEVRERIAAI